jgi:hypothetical protein
MLRVRVCVISISKVGQGIIKLKAKSSVQAEFKRDTTAFQLFEK